VPDLIHPVAKCRWCGAHFAFIHGAHWICTTPACAEKQIANAETKADPDAGESPYLYLPLPLQVDMRHSPYKRTLVAGAAGSTKSFGGRWCAYQQCLDVPGSQVLLLRCTFRQLEETHLKYMHGEAAAFVRNGIEAKYSGAPVMKMVIKHGPGLPQSQISMGYCDDRRDIPQHLGPEWDLIIFEEANSFLPEALSEIAARDRGSFTAHRPAGEPRDGRTLCLANPGGRGSLFLVDHYIKRDPDPTEYPAYNAALHGFFPANLEDNPFLPPDYATTTLSGLTAARYQQMRFGRWDIVSGQFFELQQDVHVQRIEAA
jgi:hypothetical protein